MPPAYDVDIRALGEKSPVIFRGEIVEVHSTGENSPDRTQESLATFRIDRLYRGSIDATVSFKFAYEEQLAFNGHDCIDFRPNTYWVVFARQNKESLELIDDCVGAFSISPSLGPVLQNSTWFEQMEADFLSGLQDSDPGSRLLSIQRLGGLALASSRDALHKIIETGDERESKWAIYAALRTGDISVLPEVRHLLELGDRSGPESSMALRLQNVAAREAVPELIAILESAPGELTRACVTVALGEKIKDRRAVPSLAAHLTDPDRSVRYNALDGLKNITHEAACTLPWAWQESDVNPQISACKAWWDAEGRRRLWNGD